MPDVTVKVRVGGVPKTIRLHNVPEGTSQADIAALLTQRLSAEGNPPSPPVETDPVIPAESGSPAPASDWTSWIPNPVGDPGLTGLADGLTLGAAGHLAGGLTAATEGFFGGPEAIVPAYQRTLGEWRDQKKQAPWAALTGEVGGAIASGGALAKLLRTLPGLQSLGPKTFGAVTGAGEGATAGALLSEENPAWGAALGGLLGGPSGFLGAALNRPRAALKKRYAKPEDRAIQEVRDMARFAAADEIAPYRPTPGTPDPVATYFQGLARNRGDLIVDTSPEMQAAFRQLSNVPGSQVNRARHLILDRQLGQGDRLMATMRQHYPDEVSSKILEKPQLPSGRQMPRTQQATAQAVQTPEYGHVQLAEAQNTLKIVDAAYDNALERYYASLRQVNRANQATDAERLRYQETMHGLLSDDPAVSKLALQEASTEITAVRGKGNETKWAYLGVQRDLSRAKALQRLARGDFDMVDIIAKLTKKVKAEEGVTVQAATKAAKKLKKQAAQLAGWNFLNAPEAAEKIVQRIAGETGDVATLMRLYRAGATGRLAHETQERSADAYLTRLFASPRALENLTDLFPKTAEQWLPAETLWESTRRGIQQAPISQIVGGTDPTSQQSFAAGRVALQNSPWARFELARLFYQGRRREKQRQTYNHLMQLLIQPSDSGVPLLGNPTPAELLRSRPAGGSGANWGLSGANAADLLTAE